uniref:Uncharacterized protein n=1 Tax=Nelumbo nucifera TaxID=4432 RepID=A0A822YA71_NELNU|nr:TPA_asm: hypothetical protein HUJ06_030775 [Nelumbo nucifera]
MREGDFEQNTAASESCSGGSRKTEAMEEEEEEEKEEEEEEEGESGRKWEIGSGFAAAAIW